MYKKIHTFIYTPKKFKFNSDVNITNYRRPRVDADFSKARKLYLMENIQFYL